MTQHVLEVTRWFDFSSVINFFLDIKKGMKRNAKVRATIKELQRLSDYELRDIGINRGMIRSIAEESHND
jgi:uncharacterized protein YjiS (DUF1127 family)